MKKIIFLFLVLAISSPALATDWAELAARSWDAEQRTGNRMNANKATLEMAKSWVRAQESPYPDNQPDFAALYSLADNPGSLAMNPYLLSQMVSDLMGRISERNARRPTE